MAEFENPFANPDEQFFRDPSIQQATTSAAKTQPLADFNPFVNQQYGSLNNGPQKQPSSPLAAAGLKWEEDELRRKQQELDRRAAELEQREQAMQQNLRFAERKNNFPPLPKWFPLQPCFYQDISVDIPVEFQKTVRIVYHLWIAYACVLMLNIVGSLAYMIASLRNGFVNSSSTTFMLSVILAILFMPSSFICWYQPVYKAFQKDSSFSFFLFFFIFFFQFCYTVLQCLALDGWGTVGLITSLPMLTSRFAGSIFVGAIMIVIGFMFGLLAGLELIVLLRIHKIYGSTGASFAKAQQELADNVMHNKSVQQTAGNMAASAARATIGQSLSGFNR